MKQLVLVLLIWLSGCAHANLTCPEICAISEMACQGISMGTMSSSGFGYQRSSRGIAVANSRGNFNSVSCRMPANKDEEDRILVELKSAEEKKAIIQKGNQNVAIGTFVVGILMMIFIGSR